MLPLCRAVAGGYHYCMVMYGDVHTHLQERLHLQNLICSGAALTSKRIAEILDLFPNIFCVFFSVFVVCVFLFFCFFFGLFFFTCCCGRAAVEAPSPVRDMKRTHLAVSNAHKLLL